MDALLAEKMALETKWNNTYLTKGVYTIDMKSLESKINDVKTKIIQRDTVYIYKNGYMYLSMAALAVFMAGLFALNDYILISYTNINWI